jgi:cysteinyl-tRNA synthetase
MKYLGESFDIHTGGIDHLGVHHPAEIAQSEGASGRQFVKYWVHRVFIMVDGKKMSKSLENFYTLEDVKKKGFGPIAMRYLFLTGHYRTPQNFTWESLKAADQAYKRLKEMMGNFYREAERNMLSEEKMAKINAFREAFGEKLSDDLNMPGALAVVWEVAKSNIPGRDKYDLLVEFDRVLGLGLGAVQEVTEVLEVPEAIRILVKKRDEARRAGDYEAGDSIRKEIEGQGYRVEDTAGGSVVKKIN